MVKHPEDDIINLTLTIDRFEDETVVLVFDGDEITMPKKLLPRGVKESDVICMTVATEENEREHREKKAKDLLNGILRGEN